MLEAIVLIITVMTMLFFYFGWPILRSYNSFKADRLALVKRYNRVWRSRRDLLVRNSCRQN